MTELADPELRLEAVEVLAASTAEAMGRIGHATRKNSVAIEKLEAGCSLCRVEVAEQISRLQDSSFGVHELVLQLNTQFKDERKQTREAIQSIANAMDRSEKLQDDRHEKTLSVQQKNLDTNLSLLEIFQSHQARVAELDSKIKTNSVAHKALIGLGMGFFILAIGFISSMVLPGIDNAFHGGVAAFIKLLPRFW